MDAWTRRYRFHLESIPELLSILRSSIVPLQAVRYDAEKISGNSDGNLLPFRDGNVDAADLLWALLVIYAREVADIVGGSSPQALRTGSWSTAREIQGLSATTRPHEAAERARGVVRWLLRCGDVCEAHTELEPAEEQLFTLVRGLRAECGIEERPRSSARRCAVCGKRAVVAVYANVGRGGERSLIRCASCGAEDEEALRSAG